MFYCNKGTNIEFFTEEKRLQKESLSQNKKHHMLLPNTNEQYKIRQTQFKTSYVITKRTSIKGLT